MFQKSLIRKLSVKELKAQQEQLRKTDFLLNSFEETNRLEGERGNLRRLRQHIIFDKKNSLAKELSEDPYSLRFTSQYGEVYTGQARTYHTQSIYDFDFRLQELGRTMDGPMDIILNPQQVKQKVRRARKQKPPADSEESLKSTPTSVTKKRRSLRNVSSVLEVKNGDEVISEEMNQQDSPHLSQLQDEDLNEDESQHLDEQPNLESDEESVEREVHSIDAVDSEDKSCLFGLFINREVFNYCVSNGNQSVLECCDVVESKDSINYTIDDIQYSISQLQKFKSETDFSCEAWFIRVVRKGLVDPHACLSATDEWVVRNEVSYDGNPYYNMLIMFKRFFKRFLDATALLRKKYLGIQEAVGDSFVIDLNYILSTHDKLIPELFEIEYKARPLEPISGFAKYFKEFSGVLFLWLFGAFVATHTSPEVSFRARGGKLTGIK